MNQRLIVAIAAGLAGALVLAGWRWLADEPVADRVRLADRATSGSAGQPAVLARADDASPSKAPGARPLLAAPSPPPTARTAVPITVTAPQKFFVGDMNDVVVALAANAGVREVGFTVQLDPNVLQVRAATEGDWSASAGAVARFTSEISSGEDRVQIRSELPGASGAGGSVAVIRLQGVATGVTSVLISDVVVKDALGRWVAAALSTPSLQVTVDSPPAPGRAPPGRSGAAILPEPPADGTPPGD
ncbi:MAG: hypothetical protein JO090_03750 [Rhizobacter sp.]|nr:hypothetical protein [Rhizobacter sp.]